MDAASNQPTSPLMMTDSNGSGGGLKVIGAGLGRTGTASLQQALAILYGAPCYHMKEVMTHPERVRFWTEAALQRKSSEEFREHFKDFAATVDFPSCLHWEQLMVVYPDAKVILSVRDPDSWVKSAKETILLMNSSYSGSPWGIWLLQTFVPSFRALWRLINVGFWSPLFDGDYSDSNLRRKFIEWAEDVKKSCPNDRLLVFEASQGWGPLCAFLGVPVPETPYPNVNDTKAFKSIVHRLNVVGYVLGGLSALVLAAGLNFAYSRRAGFLSLISVVRPSK